MSPNTNIRPVVFSAPAAEAQPEDHFAERRHIALLEHDPALRPVLIRTLLRLGCVVSAKREVQQVIEALQTGPLDGVVVALEGSLSLITALHAANRCSVPVVVLLDSAPEPHLSARFPSIAFLQKPFDMRELLTHLHLPEQAIIRTES